MSNTNLSSPLACQRKRYGKVNQSGSHGMREVEREKESERETMSSGKMEEVSSVNSTGQNTTFGDPCEGNGKNLKLPTHLP